jgi:hypothetical protein
MKILKQAFFLKAFLHDETKNAVASVSSVKGIISINVKDFPEETLLKRL